MATQNYFKVKNGIEVPRSDQISVTDAGAPAVRPTLLLDFANARAADPKVTFTRGTYGYYYPASSTIGEQNLALYSEQFDNAAWVKSEATITANATTAPNGTATADKLVDNGNNAEHSVYQNVYVLQNVRVTFSVYAKAAELGTLRLALGNGSGLAYVERIAFFDLVNGNFTTVGPPNAIGQGISAWIYDMGNGWYRCCAAFTPTASGQVPIYISCAPKSYDYAVQPIYSGNTTGLYIWGAQFEHRGVPSNYVQTTSTQVINPTRAFTAAPNNQPRFDHDPITGESKGLLIEETRTSIIPLSNLFATYTWQKDNAKVADNVAWCPSGGISATKLYESSTTNTYHRLYQYTSASASTAYTASIYVKAAERTAVQLRLVGTAPSYSYVIQSFDLLTGTTVAGSLANYQFSNIASDIQSVGNGWYKISVTGTSNASANNVGIEVYTLNSSYATDYVGVVGNGIYVYNAQVEVGNFASTYIGTGYNTFTRSTTAWYQATDNYLRSVGANSSRNTQNNVGYLNGVSQLLEPSASNNTVGYTSHYKKVIDGYAQSILSLAAPGVTAPDGTQSATVIYSTGIDPYHVKNVAITSGSTYTASIYVKGKGTSIGKAVDLWWWTTKGNEAMGRVTLTSAWQRITATLTATTTETASIRLEVIADASNPAAGDMIYAWGLMVEPGYGAASFYYPSTEAFTSRASTGSYFNNYGIISYAGNDTQRINYNPFSRYLLDTGFNKLLIEDAATNLFPYSYTLSSWNNTNVTVSDNAITSPDGTINASKIVPNTSNVVHRVQTNTSVTSGGVYTTSFYAKAGGYNFIRFEVSGVSAVVIYDLNKGTYKTNSDGTSYNVKDVSINQIYRNLTFTPTSATHSGYTATIYYTPGTYSIQAGQVVSISGCLPNHFNGTYLVQSAGSGYFTIRTYEQNLGAMTQFGTITLKASDDWYYCTCTYTAAASTVTTYFYPLPTENTFTHSGDGTSGAYIWGVQLENNPAATSYIPTNGATATRAADITTTTVANKAADIWTSTGSTRLGDYVSLIDTYNTNSYYYNQNFTSWYNYGEGTLYAEATPIANYSNGNPTQGGIVAQFSDAYNYMQIYRDSANAAYYSVYNHDALQVLATNGSAWSKNTPYKLAFTYKQNDFAVSVNGNTPTTDTSGNVTFANQLWIGNNPSATGSFNGWVKKVAYYPKRLANTELQVITTQ